MRRALVLILALLACAGVRAQEPVLALVPDPRPAPPHPGEMVLVTLRGLYPANIALESMAPPLVEGFGWTELGHDRWYDDRRDGRAVRVFERRMAFFPDRPGTLELPAFTHNLVLAEPGGARVRREVRSDPVALEVAPPPEWAGWWLPVRRLTATDRWEGAPESMAIGSSATRIVVVEVEGIGPERLPPMPDLRQTDIFAFPLPETRSVTLTPDGPVSRVEWRWSVLPEGPRPAVMAPLVIPWFDTGARVRREVVLAPQTVAIDGAVMGDDPHDGRLDAWARVAGPAGLGLGFVGGALAVLGRRGLRRPAWIARAAAAAAARAARWAAWRRLARAVAARDPFAARTAARAAVGAAPVLDRFDRLAYGPPGSEPAALSDLAAALRRPPRDRG